MKPESSKLILAGLLAAIMAAPLPAGDTGEDRNLFETAGPKGHHGSTVAGG